MMPLPTCQEIQVLKFVISEHPSIEYSHACIYMYMYMAYLNFAHLKPS